MSALICGWGWAVRSRERLQCTVRRKGEGIHPSCHRLAMSKKRSSDVVNRILTCDITVVYSRLKPRFRILWCKTRVGSVRFGSVRDKASTLVV